MPENKKIPFPRHKFIRPLNELAPPQRVLRLINTHQELGRKYQKSYHSVFEAIGALQSESYPGLASMSDEQREIINKNLLDARDEIARGFTQTIKLYETTINELLPGTFPKKKEPYGSYDLEEWIYGVLGWLCDVLHEIADVFEVFGFPEMAEGIDGAADAIEGMREAFSDINDPDLPDPLLPPEPPPYA